MLSEWVSWRRWLLLRELWRDSRAGIRAAGMGLAQAEVGL